MYILIQKRDWTVWEYLSHKNISLHFLCETPREVELLECVEPGQDTGAGDTSEDVGAGALHHRHEALVLHNLHGAVDGALVLDSGSRGHHHTTPDQRNQNLSILVW